MYRENKRQRSNEDTRNVLNVMHYFRSNLENNVDLKKDCNIY